MSLPVAGGWVRFLRILSNPHCSMSLWILSLWTVHLPSATSLQLLHLRFYFQLFTLLLSVFLWCVCSGTCGWHCHRGPSRGGGPASSSRREDYGLGFRKDAQHHKQHQLSDKVSVLGWCSIQQFCSTSGPTDALFCQHKIMWCCSSFKRWFWVSLVHW